MTTPYADPIQPAEEVRLSIGFTNRLASGDTVDAITSIVLADSAGTDVSATLIRESSEQIDTGDKAVSAVFVGGTDGMQYKATAKVVTADGDKLEGDLYIPVKQF